MNFSRGLTFILCNLVTVMSWVSVHGCLSLMHKFGGDGRVQGWVGTYNEIYIYTLSSGHIQISDTSTRINKLHVDKHVQAMLQSMSQSSLDKKFSLSMSTSVIVFSPSASFFTGPSIEESHNPA